MEFVLTGADSLTRAIAIRPTTIAPLQYQAGASGFPVHLISAVMTNCVEPPKVEIANA